MAEARGTPRAPGARLLLAIGEKAYLLEPVRAASDAGPARHWRLTAVGRKGALADPYDVHRDDLGIVRCTCPDFEFRRKDNFTGLCKHGRALVQLGLIEPDAADAESDPAEWPAWADESRWQATRGVRYS